MIPYDMKHLLRALNKAMQEDPKTAEAWHDSIVLGCCDTGVDSVLANKIAVRLMWSLFSVDTANVQASEQA